MKISIFITLFFAVVDCFLEKRIRKSDVFHHTDVKHKINKRDIYSRSPEHRGLEFQTLGRDFKLNLKKYRSLFTQDFRVVAIDNKGKERVLDIDPNLYHGHLEDDEHSEVQAYLDDSGVFTGIVITDGKKFVFEPSWRHLPDSNNASMMVYEEKEVDFEYDLGEKFCETIRAPGFSDPGDTAHLDDDDDVDDDDINNVEAHESEKDSHHQHHDEKISKNQNHKKNHNNNHNNNNNNNHQHNKHHNHHHNGEEAQGQEEVRGRGRNRSKRSSSCTKDDRMICTLMLVADYKFYDNMGNKDFQTTTGYLISVIDNVNQIYNKQDFGNCGNGFEFEIREIRIHQEPSDGSDPLYDYNKDEVMNTSYLLERFSRNPRYEEFCLAHLFTYTAFPVGVLGLAYIGSPRMGSLGGVCSSTYAKDGYQLYINTGWSSSVNKFHRKLLTIEAYLVTAHELGHSWGSEHDPDIEECSPRQGKYIMYMYSVSGREENNKNFSPCSRRSMAALIRGKAQYCFSKKSGAFCGNFKVEEGEECDEGPVGLATGVSCCDNCKLKSSSKCSDINSQCCERCQYAPSTTSCMGEQDLGCKTGSKCSGFNTSCTPAENRPDGTNCSLNGKCVGGRCFSICEYNDKMPCICMNATDSCKWCCKETTDSLCLPYDRSLNLPEGTPCYQGSCNQQGVCQKEAAQNTILRLWNIIENIDANKLVMFMRANIVGTVIIFSLVVWIPASCAVAYVDRKRTQKQKEEYRWYSPDNDNLLLPGEDERNIKVSPRVWNDWQ